MHLLVCFDTNKENIKPPEITESNKEIEIDEWNHLTTNGNNIIA